MSTRHETRNRTLVRHRLDTHVRQSVVVVWERSWVMLVLCVVFVVAVAEAVVLVLVCVEKGEEEGRRGWGGVCVRACVLVVCGMVWWEESKRMEGGEEGEEEHHI